MLEYHIIKNSQGSYDLIGKKHCGNGNDALYFSGKYLTEAIEHSFKRQSGLYCCTNFERLPTGEIKLTFKINHNCGVTI